MECSAHTSAEYTQANATHTTVASHTSRAATLVCCTSSCCFSLSLSLSLSLLLHFPPSHDTDSTLTSNSRSALTEKKRKALTEQRREGESAARGRMTGMHLDPLCVCDCALGVCVCVSMRCCFPPVAAAVLDPAVFHPFSLRCQCMY